MAQHHARRAGQGGAHHIEAGRVEMGEVERPRRPETEMGIVGEQRLTALATVAGDHPVVRADIGRGTRRRAPPQFIEAAEFIEAGEAQLRQGHGPVTGVGCPQGGDLIGGQAAGETGAQQLVAPVAGQIARHELEDHQGIGGRPGFRLGHAKDEVFERKNPAAGLEIGIDPLGVGLIGRLRVTIEGGETPRRHAVYAEGAEEPVDIEESSPQIFRKPPGAEAAAKFDLPQAVLGMDETEAEVGVRLGRGVNMRHPVGLAQNLDFGVETGEGDFPVDGGQGGPQA